jgi:regulator of sigma E protease
MMVGFLYNLIALVVTLVAIVTVHEYGHFIAARLMGVKVLRFSIGFGKPLWRWQPDPDGTEYVVAGIPLGGYVKMLDGRETPVPEVLRASAYDSKPAWRRAVILIAGPAANLLFAMVAYWVVFMAGVPGIRPILGEVPVGTPAAVAGFESEDVIVSVSGAETETWQAVTLALLDAVLDPGPISIQVRDQRGDLRTLALAAGDPSELTEPGHLLPGIGFTFFRPRYPMQVGAVDAGGPAEGAGLLPGDRILEVNGIPTADWREAAAEIRDRPATPVTLLIDRGGVTRPVDLVTRAIETEEGPQGRIGITLARPEGLDERLFAQQRYGPLAAAGRAVAETAGMATLTLKVLWRMVTGDVSLRNVSGPIGIAQVAGDTAAFGLTAFLKFLAVVSISIGVLNLLPIPVLDGGQLVFLAIERLRGGPLSEAAEAFGQRIGLVLLVLLMGLAFYNDLSGPLG